jgi:hypothetical protein
MEVLLKPISRKWHHGYPRIQMKVSLSKPARSPFLLNTHLSQVITIVLVNVENLPATSFTSAFESSGLSNHTYTPPSATLSLSSWPSLGSLIDAGTNVVVFMDEQANYDAVPWLIDEFSNVFEDAYGEF